MVKSNADLEAERQAKVEAEQAQNKPFINGLAGQIKSKWEVSRFARNTIEERIIDSLRRRNGEYDPEKLAQIRAQGGSEVFMMLTSIKCRAAEAWIKDVLFPAGDKPWDIVHTPLPELDPDTMAAIGERVQMEAAQWQAENQQFLPPEALQERLAQVRDQLTERMQQEADRLAERMDQKIEDQCIDGHWEDAMKEVIKDVVTYPLGCLKGPVVRRRRTLKWEQTPEGAWMPVKGWDFKLGWYRVAPFDLYP